MLENNRIRTSIRYTEYSVYTDILWVVTKCTVGAVSDFGPKFSTHVESSILPAKARNWLHVGDLRPRRSHARDRTLSQTFRIQFHYNFHILYITPPSAVAHAMFKDVQISKAQPYLETPHFVHPSYRPWRLSDLFGSHWNQPIYIKRLGRTPWPIPRSVTQRPDVHVNVRNVAVGVDLACAKQFESCRLQSPNWVLVFSLHWSLEITLVSFWTSVTELSWALWRTPWKLLWTAKWNKLFDWLKVKSPT